MSKCDEFEKGECLYLIKFNNHPNLFKIGISVNINNRIRQLKEDHGEVKSISVYYGKNYKYVERILHNIFGNERVKVHGQGGTEFFKNTICLEVLENTCKSCDLILKNPIVKGKKKVEKKKVLLTGYDTTFRPLYIKHLITYLLKFKECYVIKGSEVWNVLLEKDSILKFTNNYEDRNIDTSDRKDLSWLQTNLNITDHWN